MNITKKKQTHRYRKLVVTCGKRGGGRGQGRLRQGVKYKLPHTK